VVRDLFGGVRGLSHALDRFGEIIRLLGTGNREFAAKNKAGHTVNACFLCGKTLSKNRVNYWKMIADESFYLMSIENVAMPSMSVCSVPMVY